MILPLANARDKRTQVRWGAIDFERRFGRRPEGMWLPETAVDVDSLEALAEEGIAFTILEPHQAARWRRIGEDDWTEHAGAIDPTMPYRCTLPSGRTIAIFFYDGPISRAVAFERLLARGENLAHRLLGAFSEGRPHPQLVHLATDGETYGHHHLHGDMALAYALDYIDSQKLARIANYGWFLAENPPTHEVEIVEDTSWSCIHGIDRWRMDCGCSTGAGNGWNQQPRATTISRSCSTAAKTTCRASWRSMPSTRPSPCSSCWRCSATPCSCTRAAAGSSTTRPASRQCRCWTTRRGRSSSRRGSPAARSSSSCCSASATPAATFPSTATGGRSTSAR